MQASTLTGAWRSVPVKQHFTLHTWDTTHNVMSDGHDRVLALIADL
jgi:hypothetical protein